MKRAGFGLLVAASWILILLWAAGIDWSAPLAPAEQRDFAGREFKAVFGIGRPGSQHLRVESAGEDHTALQSLAPVDIDAERFTTLRYRFADFPRTLENSLVFRTEDDPDDVHTFSLPWPGAGVGAFDLRQVEEWRGRIIELGFAQFPTGQVVPPDQGFHPFGIEEAALWSPSWRGDLAALRTDWFGAWPWSQRSVHALGRESEAPRAHSIVLALALAAGAVALWAAIFFGWRERKVWAFAVGAAAFAWFALDLRWQAGLWGRLQTTRAVYAGLSWTERENTVADTDIAQAAEKVRTMLRDEPRHTRIIVQAGSGYEVLRLIWHLLPRNVGPASHAARFGMALPEGSLIVFYDTDEWRTRSYWRSLLAHSEHLASSGSIHGDGFEDERVVVFRFRHGH